MICRCGYTGDGPHPCHHCNSTEDNAERLYAMPIGSFSLSGMQAKASVRRSFLCAKCHAHNIAELARVSKAAHVKAEINGQD